MPHLLLKSEMEKRCLKASHIAAKIGKNPSNLTRMFKGTETDFHTMLDSVRAICPDKEFEVMDKYLHGLHINHDNIQHGLEYASKNLRLESLQKLIVTAYNSKVKDMAEWALMYSYVHDFQTYTSSREELLRKVKNSIPTTIEMRSLRVLLIMEIYIVLRKFSFSHEYIEEAETLISKCSGCYKLMFTTRLWDSKMHTLLRATANIEESRKYAHKVINHTKSLLFKTTSYIHIGLTFLFEDFNKSLECFETASNILNELGADSVWINSNITFLKNYWKVDQDVNDIEDENEKAHYYIKHGMIEKGISILDSRKDTPFSLYYRFLATNEVNYLFSSLKMFKESGDLYFAKNLIEPEMKRLNMNEDLITLAFL